MDTSLHDATDGDRSAAAAPGIAGSGPTGEGRRPTVLFVCVHNAGRSQLAAGLAAHRGGDRVVVLSAGTDPDAQVSDVTLASLAELGIDRSDQVPTKLTDDLIRQADVIVALKPDLGIVPAPGAELQTWELPDAEPWDVPGVRPLREYLDQRVRELLQRLMPADRGTGTA